MANVDVDIAATKERIQRTLSERNLLLNSKPGGKCVLLEISNRRERGQNAVAVVLEMRIADITVQLPAAIERLSPQKTDLKAVRFDPGTRVCSHYNNGQLG